MSYRPESVWPFAVIVGIGLFTASCQDAQDPAPVVEREFVLKYNAVGMRQVGATVVVSEKSFKESPTTTPILQQRADTTLNGQLSGRFAYRKGQRLYVYVRFPDINQATTVMPAINGFLAGALYIDDVSVGGATLRYYDYANTAKHFTDATGHTSLLEETSVIVP